SALSAKPPESASHRGQEEQDRSALQCILARLAKAGLDLKASGGPPAGLVVAVRGHHIGASWLGTVRLRGTRTRRCLLGLSTEGAFAVVRPRVGSSQVRVDRLDMTPHVLAAVVALGRVPVPRPDVLPDEVAGDRGENQD